MKIGIYVGELDIKGGTHKQVLRLAQHLLEHGHDILVITPHYVAGKGYPEFENLPILTLQTQAGDTLLDKLKSRLRPMLLAARMPKMDIINIHDNRVILFGFAAKFLGKGKRYVWQINDIHPAFQIGAHNAPAGSIRFAPVHRLVNRFWAQTVDAITVNVSKNRERVMEWLSRDADVLYCGVDFPDHDSSVLQGLGAFKLMSTGVFFPYRNYETLVSACAEANKSLASPIELTIVGDTRYSPEYAASISALAQATGVDLAILENLTQSELETQLSQSHAFAFINVDQSWGLSVFEAAARKKPVILSKSVGASELLSGKPGFLMVDPLSQGEVVAAILALAMDKVKCVETAEQAFSTVKGMSWQAMYCAPAIEIFNKLLK